MEKTLLLPEFVPSAFISPQSLAERRGAERRVRSGSLGRGTQKAPLGWSEAPSRSRARRMQSAEPVMFTLMLCYVLIFFVNPLLPSDPDCGSEMSRLSFCFFSLIHGNVRDFRDIDHTFESLPGHPTKCLLAQKSKVASDLKLLP